MMIKLQIIVLKQSNKFKMDECIIKRYDSFEKDGKLKLETL